MSRSPSASTTASHEEESTRTPLRRLPLVEPRSNAYSFPFRRSTARCRRLMLGSKLQASGVPFLPTTAWPAIGTARRSVVASPTRRSASHHNSVERSATKGAVGHVEVVALVLSACECRWSGAEANTPTALGQPIGLAGSEASWSVTSWGNSQSRRCASFAKPAWMSASSQRRHSVQGLRSAGFTPIVIRLGTEARPDTPTLMVRIAAASNRRGRARRVNGNFQRLRAISSRTVSASASSPPRRPT